MNHLTYSFVCSLTPHLSEKKVHNMLMAEYSNEHIQGEWWKENVQMESDLNTTTFHSIDQGVVERGEFTRRNSRDAGILMTSIWISSEDGAWQVDLVRV